MNTARGFAWVAMLLFVGGILPVGYAVAVGANGVQQSSSEQFWALGVTALLEFSALIIGVGCWRYTSAKIAAVGSGMLIALALCVFLVQRISQMGGD